MLSMRWWMFSLAVGAVVAFGFVAFDWAGRNEATGNSLLSPDDQALVALGSRIYTDNCASCHGINLEGQVEDWQSPGTDGLMPAPPHNETGHTWHHSDEVLFKITKFGIAKVTNLKDYKSAMPAYEDVLSDEEIIAALSFIKSSWPDEIRAGHDEMNARFSERPTETR